MTLSEFENKMSPFFGDICIVHDVFLIRLLGVAEDDVDFYYVGEPLGKEPIWYSAVGACESLRGKVERYDVMDNVFRLNEKGM